MKADLFTLLTLRNSPRTRTVRLVRVFYLVISTPNANLTPCSISRRHQEASNRSLDGMGKYGRLEAGGERALFVEEKENQRHRTWSNVMEYCHSIG
jgi:hypothetical protein